METSSDVRCKCKNVRNLNELVHVVQCLENICVRNLVDHFVTNAVFMQTGTYFSLTFIVLFDVG